MIGSDERRGGEGGVETSFVRLFCAEKRTIRFADCIVANETSHEHVKIQYTLLNPQRFGSGIYVDTEI